MGVGDDLGAVEEDRVPGEVGVQLRDVDALAEEIGVVARDAFDVFRGGRGQADLEFLEHRGRKAGQGVLVGVTLALAGEVQSGQDRAGAAVALFEQPGRSGVAWLADLPVGGQVGGVGADLETADGLHADLAAVVDFGDGVDAADDAVGDRGGPPALDYLVVELRLPQLAGCHNEVEDVLAEGAVLDGGDRAVAGHPQVGAPERTEAVAVHAVVVVRAGLRDRIAQRTVRAVQHVPVAEHVRGAVGPVEDDAADRARPRRIGGGKAHTHAGLDRVQPPHPGRDFDLGHRTEVRLVAALDHIGGHLDAIHSDRLGDRRCAQRLQRLRLGLARHRELQHDLLAPPAAGDLAADADGGDVRILQQFRAAGADIAAQGIDQLFLGRAGAFGPRGSLLGLGGHDGLSLRQRRRRMRSAPGPGESGTGTAPAAARLSRLVAIYSLYAHEMASAPRASGASEDHPAADARPADPLRTVRHPANRTSSVPRKRRLRNWPTAPCNCPGAEPYSRANRIGPVAQRRVGCVST